MLYWCFSPCGIIFLVLKEVTVVMLLLATYAHSCQVNGITVK